MFGIIFAEAFSSLTSHKLRTFLTTLGVIIGVSSVVLMLFIGQGAESDIRKSIESMGSNILMVVSGSTTAGGIRSGSGGSVKLTVDDAKAITDIRGVSKVAPAQPNTAQVVNGSNNWSTSIYGSTPEYLSVRDWQVVLGNSFSERDMRSGTNVAVLGQVVRDNLFGSENPIGKTIRIKNIPFEIVGILGIKGQSLDGRDQDDTVIIPLTTAQRKLFGTQFPGSVRFIMVKAASAETMDDVQSEITRTLRERHHIKPTDDDDFSIRNLSAIAESQAATARIMSILLGSIASISLLVGGIGIMNIMLVSVTERTREIGIRKAIGAREKVIMLQFLVESVLISGIGSITGLMIGIAGALMIKLFTDISVSISLWPMLISLGVAASVGIFFGYYPAQQAAKLDPIEALRYQ